jgi:hypothetical protein
MSETFNARVGRITIDEETITLESKAQLVRWEVCSFNALLHRREYLSLVLTVGSCFAQEPRRFAKVAYEVVARDTTYLGHPVIRAWVWHNSQLITHLRKSEMVPLSDERIRQAEDCLRDVGGNAAVEAAKRGVKNRDVIFASQADELYKKVRPLHDIWWKARKQYSRRALRETEVLREFVPGSDKPLKSEIARPIALRKQGWASGWIKIFDLCSEQKRQDKHLRQAIILHLEEKYPGSSLSNLRRGRKHQSR